MPYKIAFMGFRHGHIMDIYNRLLDVPELELVSCCEEQSECRNEINSKGAVSINYSNFSAMLDEVECDVVAVGDYYSKRGAIIIEALNRNKHVISDKPMCISLSELDEIERLSKEKGLVVGCQLDLRDYGQFMTLREIILNGELGEIHSIAFGGQHPLLRGTRAEWYFEQGKHGGTINDIGIHGLDIVEWMTGKKITSCVAARSWNAFVPDAPWFHDAGQFMLKMENECGILADVSYFMPDAHGYTLEQYWRFTVFGTKGVAETSINMNAVKLALNKSNGLCSVPIGERDGGGYLRSFVERLQGKEVGVKLSGKEVFRAQRLALTVQLSAFESKRDVPL